MYRTLNKLNPDYMNDSFKLRNTDRLEKIYAKPGNSLEQEV